MRREESEMMGHCWTHEPQGCLVRLRRTGKPSRLNNCERMFEGCGEALFVRRF